MAGTFHWQTRRFIGARTQWEAKNEKRTISLADAQIHWGANPKPKIQF